MRIVTSISWFLFRILAVYSFAVIILIYFALSDHWIAGFMMMSFPIIIILNFLFLLVFLLFDKKRVLFPAGILLISLVFLPRTYGTNGVSEVVKNKEQKTFRLLNYNVHQFFFNSDEKQDKESEGKWIRAMRGWVINSEADILCMPEYRSAHDYPEMNINRELRKNGYNYFSFMNSSQNSSQNYEGLAIFSKYPIIETEEKYFGSLNGMLRADIKIKADTIRVIAVHLYSMTLELSKFVEQRKADGVKKEGKIVIGRIKSGFVGHAEEYPELEAWIKSSPYPVIVCGDFNETPYGYVYGKTRDLLTNAFEEKGRGFGFTYNHLPYFIRIDHQFYDAKKLNLLHFETIDSVKYSDHYPLIGTYQVKR